MNRRAKGKRAYYPLRERRGLEALCDKFPYLRDEMRFLKIRDAHRRPSVGICLGAQLMAKSLGGEVYPGLNEREFGVKQLIINEHGEKTPFQILKDYPVMEAHNDTFDLPDGATLLASTTQYQNQAFIHHKSLAFQFHPEVDSQTVQIWMDILQRNDNQELKDNFHYIDSELRPKVIEFWRLWLDVLEA